MALILENARVFRGGVLKKANVKLSDGMIAAVGENIPVSADDVRFSCEEQILIPGFADVHVHLREPGFSEKETIAAGTAAAKRAGVSVCCPMPNLDPAPDTLAHLEAELALIRRDAQVRVVPVGCLTMGRAGKEPADLEAMAPYVCAFSDDGSGVADTAVMRECMKRIAAFDGLVTAHCEFKGYRGNASEWRMIKRDIKLVRETGCRYHVCHLSTRESLELVREAKAEGLPVTCETAPHYLLLCDDARREDTDGRFIMNPPLRSLEDQRAMVAGLADGSIDCIATDHAPHTPADKARGAMGIVGMETAFPVLFTDLVNRGFVSFARLIDAMSVRPRDIFRLGGGRIEPGQPAELALLDLNAGYAIDPGEFASKGRNTPFEGWPVKGRVTKLFGARGE